MMKRKSLLRFLLLCTLSFPRAFAEGYEVDISGLDAVTFYNVLSSLQSEPGQKLTFETLDCDYLDGVLDHVQLDDRGFRASDSLQQLCDVIKKTPGTGWSSPSFVKKGQTSTDIGPGGCDDNQHCYYSY